MRQKYKDVKIEKVNSDKFPVCQLKYDGIWCLASAVSSRIDYLSRNYMSKKIETNYSIPDASFVGELMYGSEWAKQDGREGLFYVFDIVDYSGGTLKHLPYGRRYSYLKELFRLNAVPAHWRLVANFETALVAQRAWDNHILTRQFEGLVFRNMSDPWDVTLLRAKYQAEIDLRIVDYVEGQGKHLGKLGSLVAVCDRNITHLIGGGLSDDLRSQIWQDKQRYLGRVFKATFKKQFASGKLRHPNFSAWHSEK